MATDFSDPPLVKHLEIALKMDYATVVVCSLASLILAIPCRQDGLTNHNATLFLDYCTFLCRDAKGYTL